MLPIKILAAGTLRESYLRDACREYEKRLQPMCGLSIMEIAEVKLPRNPSPAQIERALEQEAASFLKKIPPRAFVAALCVEGKTMDSPAFANILENAAKTHPLAVFLIGSSHGMGESLKRAAHLRISLSPMTFPHQLARVLLLEQLYRAGAILSGGKYHK